MAIRAILICPEAVPGVAATGGGGNPYKLMRVMKWTPTYDPKLDEPRETTGSTIVLQRARPGPRVLNFSGQARAYFDLSVHWFAMYHGLPTIVVDVGSAATVQSHTFLPGGVSPITYTIKWKQTGSGGTIWRQATGCVLKTLKLGIVANMGLVFDFSGHGRTVTTISAPSVPSDLTAAYNQPMSMDQQGFYTGTFTSPIASPGTAWLKVKKLDLSLDNGITPDWSVAPSRDVNRMKMGDTVLKGDIQAFWDAYAGSMIEAGDSATQLFSQINYVVVDTGTAIGTGTPTKPLFYALLKKPFVQSPSEDDSNTDQEEKANLDLGYDSTLGSAASFTFYNLLVAGEYAGS